MIIARLFGFVVVALLAGQFAMAESPDFSEVIRPILSNHCFACHGPDEENRIADVRLDVADEVDLEDVLDRISSDDPDYVMPPPDINKPLSVQQIRQIQSWIEHGAEYQQHWSFVPPQVTLGAIPAGAGDAERSDQRIDQLVRRRLERSGLTPAERADKRTLIRRVTMDLTGLPPSVDEVNAFVEDSSDRAYEILVERLLARPHYGEHMARYWLDLVRFADTNGLHHDHYREMTPYRDWVIRAFNENLPYDEFTKAQIAGDLYEDPTIDQQIASGFNRLHLIIDVGTALPQESFMRNVVDRVSSVGTAFLGLTLECAVCHDHKYDPITQRDFYQFYAFFNNFDGTPETGRRNTTDFKRGLQMPYLELPTPQQAERRMRLQSRVDETDATLASLRAELDELKKPAAESDESISSNPEQAPEDELAKPNQKELLAKKQTELEQAIKASSAAKKELESLLLEISATLVMKERDEIRPAHIMVRGNYDQPGEQVERNTPGFLLPMKGDDEEERDRMDLANWLVDPSHPLTARVAVNRFWQYLFGVGLVKTSEDFGAQGEPPSHPELLDYLAIQFVRGGWDVKALLREIVLSETYQQASLATPEQFKRDPDNRLLSRGSRYRLDAEMIRDQVLSVTGLLNPSLFGKSVKTPQPEGIWKTVAMPSSYPRNFVPDSGDKIYRRSVYSFWKRGLPPPQMTIFDAPSRESCIARRERTNTPLQALVLMNEQEYFRAAMNLAAELLQQPESDRSRILRVFELATSKVPSDANVQTLDAALNHFRDLYQRDPGAADEMIAQGTTSSVRQVAGLVESSELASWTMVVHSLLNLDANRTRE